MSLWRVFEDKAEINSKLLLKVFKSKFINDGCETLESVCGDSKVSGMAAVKLSKSKIADLVQLTLNKNVIFWNIYS